MFFKVFFRKWFNTNVFAFKVSNWSWKLSDAYKQSQLRLLREEISNKKSIIRQGQSELILLKNHLKASINVIHYAHICSIFLISNDKVLTKQKDIQGRMIIGLIITKGINPEKAIFNSHILCFQNIQVLRFKDPNFSLHNKKVEISEYCCPFELLHHEVSDFNKESSDKELLKSKLKELNLSSYLKLKHSVLEENLRKFE